MRVFVKPRVVISKCLEFDHCRFNGAMISSDVVRLLKPHVDCVPICPECEIGLGVPRDPIRFISKNDQLRLVQQKTEQDVTGAMQAFVGEFLGSLVDVDGFILKSRSPSCGLRDVNYYQSLERSRSMGKVSGFFGSAVTERFPLHPVEDEGRLNNYRIREHFLTSMFTLAEFRRVKKSGRMKDLVRFQAENKFMLMSYNEKEMRILGSITANREKKPASQVFAEYEEHLRLALRNMPRYTSNINALMHVFGFFKNELSAQEKSFFLDSLDQYRVEKIPLSVPLHLVGSWIVRFKNEYLASETFFEPYPQDLVEITDSGKGREF